MIFITDSLSFFHSETLLLLEYCSTAVYLVLIVLIVFDATRARKG